jgi:hypothetical protein
MDAAAFLSGKTVHLPSPAEWVFAAGKLAVGLILVFAIARTVPDTHPYWRGCIGICGAVMTLHFGFFHLLSCGWRACRVDARPLMNWPLATDSVSDFWGRRWNLAFRDLTHRFLFRPITRRFGPTWGILAGFFASGLVHDAVISLPAGGGYGGPTLFFLLQGCALLAERTPIGKRTGLGRGYRGWIFTVFTLAAPLCLLLHPPFVDRVIVPFLDVLGAPG